jgi:hypothetical protein
MTPSDFEDALMRLRGFIRKQPARVEPVDDYEERNRARGALSPLGGAAQPVGRQ